MTTPNNAPQRKTILQDVLDDFGKQQGVPTPYHFYLNRL